MGLPGIFTIKCLDEPGFRSWCTFLQGVFCFCVLLIFLRCELKCNRLINILNRFFVVWSLFFRLFDDETVMCLF